MPTLKKHSESIQLVGKRLKKQDTEKPCLQIKPKERGKGEEGEEKQQTQVILEVLNRIKSKIWDETFKV